MPEDGVAGVVFERLLQYFPRFSVEALAARELEEARRELLRAQSTAEYAIRISAYHLDRIKRLSAYLVDANKEIAE